MPKFQFTGSGCSLPCLRASSFVVRHSALAAVPFLHFRNHVVHFLGGQFGEHRQADATRGVVLGIGQWAGDAPAFAPRITGLLMNRDRVMRFGVNPAVVQEFQQRLALPWLFRLNDEKMKDVSVTDQLDRQIEVAATLEPGAVTRGPLPPQVVPRVDVLELGAEHAGVQIIQTAVETVAVNVARV